MAARGEITLAPDFFRFLSSPQIQALEFDTFKLLVCSLQLRTQLQHQRGKFQDIVIDAGGRDSTALRAALVLSDLVLVPFQPRSIDVWAVADIAALIEEARAVRDGLQALGVLNMADTAGSDNEDAAAALADYPAISYLATPIRRRKSIANAAGNGLSVLEPGADPARRQSHRRAECAATGNLLNILRIFF